MKKQQQHIPQIPLWPMDKKTGNPIPKRDANFWRKTQGKNIECLLCYRNCKLQPGQKGWCGYRGNERGEMKLYAHGHIGALYPWVLGYGVGSPCYRPGARTVGLGALHCTAKCSFCYVSSFSTHPERMPVNDQPARMGGWYGYKTLIHPLGVIEVAKAWNCLDIALSYNEPLLSWEYSYDVARLAKQAGLGVVLFTNGFASMSAVRKIAPYISLAKIGIKGSGDPDFYTRYMRSDGAMHTVYQAMQTWRECGTRVGVADIIAPPQQQTDEQATEAQKRLYSWIAENLGPQTILTIGEMHRFAGNLVDYKPLVSSRIEDAKQRYTERQQRALAIAHDAGLHYAENDHADVGRDVTCHNCGALLLHKPAVYYDGEIVYHTPHTQYTGSGTCYQCGVSIPVVLLPDDVLQAQLSYSMEHVEAYASEVIIEPDDGG